MKRTLFKSRSCIRYIWLVLIITFVLMSSVSTVVKAVGTVTGTVFRDYNANGVQDADEPGVAGVTVNAYGAAGLVAGPILTLADGSYSITWGSVDVRVRLEFSGLPGSAQAGVFGPGSNTSVQFVTGGDVADYGINRPRDYSENNPDLATSWFVSGSQAGITETVITSHPYNTFGTGANSTLAEAQTVGTTWGLAHNRTQSILYSAAFTKRQAGYGVGGPGAIYQIPVDPVGVPTVLATIPAGTDLHDFTFPNNEDAANFPGPNSVYATVGKSAFGDLDITDDESTLYVVNLFDRSLYSIDVNSGAVTNRGGIPSPCPVAGDARPFGLAIRDGIVYVGGVCSAQSSQNRADLSAYVYTFTPAGGFSGGPVLSFPLNYPRGCADLSAGYGNPTAPIACRTGEQGALADWQPWSDVWPNPQNSTGFDSGFFAYAQPMLSDIDFVGDDLVLGFRDRMGDQVGWDDALGPLVGAGSNLFVITAGDVLCAASTGTNTWAIESGGTCGTRTNNNGTPANEQGPGNGEFYYEDNFAGAHDETTMGGLVQIPGFPEMAITAMDPLQLRSAGTALYRNDNGTGGNARRYEIFADPAPGRFSKANGLGDLEALSDAAPIEIGNYVWFDADQDGIQDATEQPLAGITVQLFDPNTNTVIGTAVTDSQGRYFFSSDPNRTNTASAQYNLPIEFNTAYQVRIDLTQALLTGFSVTTANTGQGGIPDQNDSDGLTTITPGFSIAALTTGSAGQNNHTFDFGFFTPPYSLGNRVWYDPDDSGTINGTEFGIAGVTVNLLDSTSTVIATTTTDSTGHYLFDNLLPGDYQVQIPASNFAPGGVLAGLNSSTPDETDPNNDVDSNDNGIGTVPDPVNGILSNTVTLGPGTVEPTGETDLGTLGSGVAANNRSNLTVDFGFTGASTNYSLGNRVWLDNNNNGLIDPGEPGRGGVVVNLLDSTGTTILRTLTTDANGYYLFDNLPPGDYIVEIAASNFVGSGALVGLSSSTGAGQEADPNLDGDSNDNGLDTPVAGAIRSGIVTLGPGTTEPTGETDLGPNGSGIASNDRSNLTVDFGFFGTPVNPPVAGGPAPIRLDPAIVKLVEPAFALPGEDVEWVITVSNPHSVSIPNVSFVDTMPPQLEIIRVTTTAGTVSFSGQDVNFSIAVLNPGQSVTVRVLTLLRPGTPIPFVITNQAVLTSGYVGTAEATLISASRLPNTGYEPFWRTPMLIAGVALALMTVVAVYSLRRTRRARQH